VLAKKATLSLKGELVLTVLNYRSRLLMADSGSAKQGRAENHGGSSV
jgi:hypothetical protein